MTFTLNFLIKILGLSRYLLAKIHFNSDWAWGSKSSLFPRFKIDATAARDPHCANSGLSEDTIHWNKKHTSCGLFKPFKTVSAYTRLKTDMFHQECVNPWEGMFTHHLSGSLSCNGFLCSTMAIFDTNKYWHHGLFLVRKQTIPTERPPLVAEVSANFCG
jgi:hypothetical protein